MSLFDSPRIAWGCHKGRHDECSRVYLDDYEVRYPCECACHKTNTAAYGRGSARLVLTVSRRSQ